MIQLLLILLRPRKKTMAYKKPHKNFIGLTGHQIIFATLTSTVVTIRWPLNLVH